MKKYIKIRGKIDYQNPYMKVHKDLIKLSDGRKKYHYVLERGESFSIIIPITKSKETYIVGQYRYAAKYYSWEFPMGFVANKNPLNMAKIELKQETGIKAKKWEKIGRFFVANGHSSQQAYVFVAHKLMFEKPCPEDHEILEIKRVSFNDINELITKGKILDGPTITALHFYNKWKGL